MKKIVAIVMMLAVLVGCSSGKETTLTGKGNANGINCEVEIISKGDKILKTKEVIGMDIKTLGLTEEQAKASMEPAAKKSNEVKGVSVKIETSEEKAIVTTEVNYSEADIDDLKKAGLVDATSDAKFVSLKVTKENYEKTLGVVFEEK